MSILDKVKSNKKSTVTVKGSIHLDSKNADALSEIKSAVGIKDLLAVVLEDPNSLKQALAKKKTVAVSFNQKIDFTIAQKDALSGLQSEGYSMDDILTVAFEKLGIQKTYKEIKSLEEESKEQTEDEIEDDATVGSSSDTTEDTDTKGTSYGMGASATSSKNNSSSDA